jgi:hypothetical protein
MNEEAGGKPGHPAGYSSIGDQPAIDAVQPESERLKTADQLPFIVRSWWLREHKGFEDFSWSSVGYLTGPLWSAYTDPLCDLGGLDYTFDLEDE